MKQINIINKGVENVALMVIHKVFTNFNNYNSNNYLNVPEEKNKVGSNRMKPNLLTPSYNNCNEWKYLNVTEENKKESKNVTQVVMNLSPEVNNYNSNNNLNVSVNNDNYFYLVKVSPRDDILNSSLDNVINLPSKSCGLVSLINLENELSNASGLSCGILSQTTENIVFLLDKNLSVKSQSLVTNTLCSDFENSASSPFESPLGFDIISNPCCLRNTSNLLFTFSSLRNLGFERDTELDIISTSSQISSILKSCQDVFFSYSWVVIEDFINAHCSVEHFQDLPDHNPGSFESGLSMTDFTICNNKFIYFDSHCIEQKDDKLFKSFDYRNFSFICENICSPTLSDSLRADSPDNLVSFNSLNNILEKDFGQFKLGCCFINLIASSGKSILCCMSENNNEDCLKFSLASYEALDIAGSKRAGDSKLVNTKIPCKFKIFGSGILGFAFAHKTIKEVSDNKHRLSSNRNSQQNSLLKNILINPGQTDEQDEWILEENKKEVVLMSRDNIASIVIHKVFTNFNNYNSNNYLNIYEEDINLNKSDVGNILILDCCLNASSFDQIEQFNFNASAKYGSSLVESCGDNFFAEDLNSLYDLEGIIVMNFFNSSIIGSICLESNFVYLTRSDMFCFNSSNTYAGENNSNLKSLEFIIMNRTGFSLKKENKILASTTNFIYQPSFLCLFQTRSFNSLPSFKQSSSVNSEFSSILSNFLSNRALLTFSDKNSRTDLDTLSSGNELICCFNSSGMDKVKFGIFEPPQFLVYSVEAVQLFKSFGLIDCGEIAHSQEFVRDSKLINNKHRFGDGLLISCLISPEQTGEQDDLIKVYELEQEESIDAPNYKEDSNLINSSVVKTGIKDCSLKCLSLDQIGRFNVDASAKYATSFESEILEENFLISFEYSDLSTNTIFSLRDLIAELKLSSDLSDNSFLCLCSSINEKSGANNFNENLEKRELATLECLDNANKTLASTTNFILDYNNFSFLSCSATPLFTLRPISIHHSVNPASSSCLSLFNISSFQTNCLALDSMQVLTNPDQLISGKFFICALISSGIDKVIDTILSVKKHKYVEVFKSFDLNNDIFFDKIVSIKQEIFGRN